MTWLPMTLSDKVGVGVGVLVGTGSVGEGVGGRVGDGVEVLIGGVVGDAVGRPGSGGGRWRGRARLHWGGDGHR